MDKLPRRNLGAKSGQIYFSTLKLAGESGYRVHKSVPFFSESMPVAKVVPGKGTIYTATIEGGSKITLRDFSRSSQQTGASWTIDVIDKTINGGRAVEIKCK